MFRHPALRLAGGLPLAEAVGIAKRSSVVLNSTLTHRPTAQSLREAELRRQRRVAASSLSLAAEEAVAGSLSSADAAAAEEEEALQLKQRAKGLVERLFLSSYSPEGPDTAATGEQVASATVSGVVEWARVVRTQSTPRNFEREFFANNNGAAACGEGGGNGAAEEQRQSLPTTSEMLLPAALHRAPSVLQICIAFNNSFAPAVEVKTSASSSPSSSSPSNNYGGGSSAASASAIRENGHFVVMCPLSVPPEEADALYGLAAPSVPSTTNGGSPQRLAPPSPYPFLRPGATVLVTGRLRTSQQLVSVANAAGDGDGSDVEPRLITRPVSFVQLGLDGVASSVRLLPSIGLARK